MGIPAIPHENRTEIRARRVLIVDDNAEFAASLRAVLASRGHDVAIVGSGAAVFSSGLEFKPDVILLDLGLPAWAASKWRHCCVKTL